MRMRTKAAMRMISRGGTPRRSSCCTTGGVVIHVPLYAVTYSWQTFGGHSWVRGKWLASPVEVKLKMSTHAAHKVIPANRAK